MAYRITNSGFGRGRDDFSVGLKALEEKPIDNRSREAIYLSSRLVEKQRLEDAKLIDKYDKACKETKEYAALQEAKKQVEARYADKLAGIKDNLIKNKDGSCYVESLIEKRDYYQKAADACRRQGMDTVSSSYARGMAKEIDERLNGSVTMMEQVAEYKRLQKLEARKQTELEPFEEAFEKAANRHRRGAVREALRRAEMMDLSESIEKANRACARNDMYLSSFEESYPKLTDEARYELNQDFKRKQSEDYDAVIAQEERDRLVDRWMELENQIWDDADADGMSKKQKASLKKSKELCDNLVDKRNWTHSLISRRGCNPDEVDAFVKTVDESVDSVSRKVQSGALPVDVLASRAYDPSSYDVTIEKVAPGTKVHNKLENSDYVTDENRCFVVTGTAGEQWPVNGDKLRSKYGLDPDTVETGNPTVAHVDGGSDGIWAIPVGGKHKIETSWGDVLETNAAGVEHGDGDYIVSNTPDFSDAWVVNGAVFGNTYEESETNSFVGKAFDSVASKIAPDDSDDMVDSIVASSANSKYETFKDKDGNQCRRNRSTGETTVWVEGYDRVRKGKVEHVKSYWKVLHK